MNTIRCDIDRTRAYLRGTMTGEEADRFEEQLRSDPQFREEFDFNQALLESMQGHYKSVLKDKLRSLDAAPAPPSREASSRRRYQLVGIAAAIALLMAVGYGLLFNQPDSQALFAQYYSPYYNVIEGTQRSANGENGSLALRLYDQQRYEEAGRVFEQALTQTPDDPALRFYAALSQLSVAQTDDAVSNLKRVLEGPSDQWHEPARWYLALAYLQRGDTDEASVLLKAIAGSEDSYHERASELLDALR